MFCFYNRTYLEKESERRRGNSIYWNGWKFYAKNDLPQQENGHDCGVFMLQVSKMLLLAYIVAPP